MGVAVRERSQALRVGSTGDRWGRRGFSRFFGGTGTAETSVHFWNRGKGGRAVCSERLSERVRGRKPGGEVTVFSGALVLIGLAGRDLSGVRTVCPWGPGGCWSDAVAKTVREGFGVIHAGNGVNVRTVNFRRLSFRIRFIFLHLFNCLGGSESSVNS